MLKVASAYLKHYHIEIEYILLSISFSKHNIVPMFCLCQEVQHPVGSEQNVSPVSHGLISTHEVIRNVLIAYKDLKIIWVSRSHTARFLLARCSGRSQWYTTATHIACQPVCCKLANSHRGAVRVYTHTQRCKQDHQFWEATWLHHWHEQFVVSVVE